MSTFFPNVNSRGSCGQLWMCLSPERLDPVLFEPSKRVTLLSSSSSSSLSLSAINRVCGRLRRTRRLVKHTAQMLVKVPRYRLQLLRRRRRAALPWYWRPPPGGSFHKCSVAAGRDDGRGTVHVVRPELGNAGSPSCCNCALFPRFGQRPDPNTSRKLCRSSRALDLFS